MFMTDRDRLHLESMDLFSLSTALHSCQNILSEKKQCTFLPDVLVVAAEGLVDVEQEG